eukprot:366331-Chlamydomonas_euryale.AAC.36
MRRGGRGPSGMPPEASRADEASVRVGGVWGWLSQTWAARCGLGVTAHTKTPKRANTRCPTGPSVTHRAPGRARRSARSAAAGATAPPLLISCHCIRRHGDLWADHAVVRAFRVLLRVKMLPPRPASGGRPAGRRRSGRATPRGH